MKFKMKELEQFVHDHIQQKIDNNELYLTGISIIMCDGEIEGIETDQMNYKKEQYNKLYGGQLL